MASVNILFYSNICEQSKMLLTLMNQEGLLRFFYLLCTDNNPQIPKCITRTPTLVIKGSYDFRIGPDTFKWLATIKQYKYQKMMHQLSQQQQKYFQGFGNTDNSNILSFSPQEMAGMSDIFSYIEGPKQDMANPKTFFDIDNLSKRNIYTMPEEDMPMGEKEHSTKAFTLQKERDMQQEAIKKDIEKFLNSCKTNK